MPTPPKATRHNNLTKLLVLLPLRANSKRTFQCETPCTCTLSECVFYNLLNQNMTEIVRKIQLNSVNNFASNFGSSIEIKNLSDKKQSLAESNYKQRIENPAPTFSLDVPQILILSQSECDKCVSK